MSVGVRVLDFLLAHFITFYSRISLRNLPDFPRFIVKDYNQTTGENFYIITAGYHLLENVRK
jgi:hypothetical protein